jgi:hypothetical protein
MGVDTQAVGDRAEADAAAVERADLEPGENAAVSPPPV